MGRPSGISFPLWRTEAKASYSCESSSLVLSLAPFKPIESVSEKFLVFKTAFLLTITSLKREEYLQALSVTSSCLEFAPVGVNPRPRYLTNIACSVVLHAFYFPPFQLVDQEKLNLGCPVRALQCYVHRSAQWRKIDQQLVCFGSPRQGS